jgi:hypothetical protein
MQTRNLGNSGLQVSALGLGCMGMSEFYGTSDEGASLATRRRMISRRRISVGSPLASVPTTSGATSLSWIGCATWQVPGV